MLLRSTLVINGFSTVLCGLALLAAPGTLAELLGVSAPALLAAVGGGLSPIGTGLVALVAAVVLIFAVLQLVGVRQMPRPA